MMSATAVCVPIELHLNDWIIICCAKIVHIGRDSFFYVRHAVLQTT